MAEVMRVKAVAVILAGGARSLVLFNEMFKGTNVADGWTRYEYTIEAGSTNRRLGTYLLSEAGVPDLLAGARLRPQD